MNVRGDFRETIRFGRMITGEAFIEDNFRDEINAKFAPLSVDMETASIAQVCHVNKVPYIAVRTITDTEDEIGAGAFFANLDKASQISANIVAGLFKELYENNEYFADVFIGN